MVNVNHGSNKPRLLGGSLTPSCNLSKIITTLGGAVALVLVTTGSNPAYSSDGSRQKTSEVTLPNMPILASDLPEGANLEIRANWTEIVSSSMDRPFVSASGRAYIKTEKGIFYNSRPQEKNTWGKVDELDLVYLNLGGEMLLFQKLEWWDMFQVPGYPDKLFNPQGVEIPRQGSLWVETLENGGKEYYKTGDGNNILSCDNTGRTEEDIINEVLIALRGINENIDFYPEFLGYYKGGVNFPDGNIHFPDMNLHLTLKRIKSPLFFVHQKLVLKNGTFVIEVIENGLFLTLSVEEFIQKIAERNVNMERAMEIMEKLNDFDTKNKRKNPKYMQNLLELYSIEKKDKFYLVDFNVLLNAIIWNVVENNGDLESVASFATELGGGLMKYANEDYSQLDTLMRYYEMAGDMEKAKEYAKKVLDYFDYQKNLNTDTQAIYEIKSKAYSILSQ